MLRINLLPGYVAQRRLTKYLTIGLIAAFILCALIPLVWYVAAQGTLRNTLAQAEDAEAKQKIVQGLRSDADSTRAQIAPIQAKVDFVKAVHLYNLQWVQFWETVAAYSDKRVIYSDAVVSGNTLTIKAYMPSIDVVGRYLQVISKEPDFQTVGIDHLPGYPESLVNKYYLGGQLIAIGSSSGSSGGGGGYPGGGGGSYPGGTSSAFSSPSGGAGGYPGSGGGSSAGPSYGTPVPIGPAGPSRSPVPVPVISEGGSSGAPGGTLDAQALYAALSTTPQFSRLVNTDVNPFIPQQQRINEVLQTLQRKVRVRREPQGFAITVTATLKKPLTAPPLPGAAGAPGAGGAYPGAGGYPGAMPGGYPGGSGSPGGYPR